MAVKSVIEAVREAMWEEMRRDERVFVMGEDIGPRGGVFLATQGFIEEFGPSRVIDTPLAEASIMGIALGASFRGMRPIPEVEFADFLWPAVNQLIGEGKQALSIGGISHQLQRAPCLRRVLGCELVSVADSGGPSQASQEGADFAFRERWLLEQALNFVIVGHGEDNW